MLYLIIKIIMCRLDDFCKEYRDLILKIFLIQSSFGNYKIMHKITTFYLRLFNFLDNNMYLIIIIIMSLG